jgi:hypothetical protein
MSNISASIMGSSFLTLMVGSKSTTITDSHPNYEKIREAVKVKNYDLVETLLDVVQTINAYSQGKITIRDGVIYYGSEEVRNSMVDRILQMMREGFDIDSMVVFLENLMQNPSRRAVDELYGFLEEAKLPITEDGHFLAYKKVSSTYKDLYTGKMDNSIGARIEMARNRVDEDKDRTCSSGLHFCAFEYLRHYHGGSGRVVIVKINPRDVVSIPSDYNNAKGRACAYEIIGEHEGHDTSPTFQDVSVYTPRGEAATPTSVTQSYKNDAYERGWARAGADLKAGTAYNSWVERNSLGHYASKEYREEYSRGYQAGWTAQSKKKAAEVQDLEEAYSRGYDNGYKVYGLEDAIYNASIQRTKAGIWASTAYQDQYAVGYVDGWAAAEHDEETAAASEDGYFEIDPYDKGYEDASTGNPYDPESEDAEYRADYARGWADAKNAAR